ncbi:MAG: PaaI family thioesterase [Rhodobiaceae bacterium]|nr:PaaI family thioesterase [Rhodobiaceae bacterium]MCC0054619.1 PaaI family thioesterase [Rhodobiaceae bacterium]
MDPETVDTAASFRAPLDPAREGWVLEEESGFSEKIGPMWYRRADDGGVHGVRLEERHTNEFGIAFGGMLMAYLDHFMAVQVRVVAPERKVTIQLHTNFMAPARVGDWLEGRTAIARRTSSLLFTKGTITCAGEVVASAHGVWKFLKPRG